MLSQPGLLTSERLELLESRDLLERVFRSLHGSDLAPEKAREVAAFLRQGRAYLSAAEQADEVVRPLLEYYAALSYVRAYLLVRTRGLRAAALSQAHGLKAVGWSDHFARNGGWLDAPVRFGGGTFGEIGKHTSNEAFVTVPHPSGRWTPVRVTGSTEYSAGYELTVGALIARLPFVASLYEAIVERPAQIWSLGMFHMDEHLEVTVKASNLGLPPQDLCASLLGLADADALERQSNSYLGLGQRDELMVRLPVELDQLSKHAVYMRTDAAMGFLVAPLLADVRLSPISYCLAVAYSLGMLVRYFPEHWVKLLTGGIGDEVMPLVRAVSQHARRMPDLVVDALTDLETTQRAV